MSSGAGSTDTVEPSPLQELELQMKSSDPQTTAHCGPSLSWEGVTYKVGGKLILNNVRGSVPGGQLCAILGPSGAGKSSLLNILAGRISNKGGVKVTGAVLRDNRIAESNKDIAYVMQDDALIETATPRESIAFSAALRLGVTGEELEQVVERVLQELDLMECADTMVGGMLVTGLSGGQRKRTSVGVELVTNPSIVFLDEPTSGLDSESAHSCISMLRRMARNGATVLCTIHQPSSQIFQMFDRVALLKNGKMLCHHRRERFIQAFKEAGFPVPQHHNPADFVMGVAIAHTDQELAGAGLFVDETPDSTVAAPLGEDKPTAAVRHAASVCTQLKHLLVRELRATVRNKPALGMRFGSTTFLGLLFGIIFMNAGSRDRAVQANLNSHLGAITLVGVNCMFGTAQPVMFSFPLERPVFLREYTTNTYGVLCYFVAKSSIEICLALVQSCILFFFVTLLVELQGPYWQLVLSGWGLGVAASSVALVVGCVVPNVRAVGELMAPIFVPQILFAGFFVRISQIPHWLQWPRFLCALKYGINLMSVVEFSNCAPNSSDPVTANENCATLLSDNSIDESDWYIYVLVLLSLLIGFRSIGAMVLIYRAQSFY
eukprot:TRINITY_DN1550_c0_g1_i1.p1 TRINITY_DN1550_c0_g1~~TRINITY_DN1550_c0_g1_i1.p1  ORF type:complete len:605 (+),score=137.62 TRINITY_DN1550_c0_g1_i1:137-1951(+)